MFNILFKILKLCNINTSYLFGFNTFFKYSTKPPEHRQDPVLFVHHSDAEKSSSSGEEHTSDSEQLQSTTHEDSTSEEVPVLLKTIKQEVEETNDKSDCSTNNKENCVTNSGTKNMITSVPTDHELSGNDVDDMDLSTETVLYNHEEEEMIVPCENREQSDSDTDKSNPRVIGSIISPQHYTNDILESVARWAIEKEHGTKNNSSDVASSSSMQLCSSGQLNSDMPLVRNSLSVPKSEVLLPIPPTKQVTSCVPLISSLPRTFVLKVKFLICLNATSATQ